MICKIIFLTILLLRIVSPQDIIAPDLFGKSEKLDKIRIKGNIAFHFKKVVKEVAQESFVSRKMDVGPLYVGVQVLEQTQKDLHKFCKSLDIGFIDAKRSRVDHPRYTLIRDPILASFREAKARCTAMNLQLPEVYNSEQIKEISSFLDGRNVKACFAGIQPDLLDSIHRHIATGFPIWRTPYIDIFNMDGTRIELVNLMDDAAAKFMYTRDGRMVITYDYPSALPFNNKVKATLGDHTYRDKEGNFSEMLMNIVCEERWDGLTLRKSTGDVSSIHGMNFMFRYPRSVPESGDESGRWENESKYVPNEEAPTAEKELLSNQRTIQQYCNSIASHADEVGKSMLLKLNNLLSLVDITVQLEKLDDQTRVKRSVFLMRFLFKSGVKILWSLFGFIQSMRVANKIKRLENAFSITQRQVDANANAIANLSSIVYGHSMAIEQLQITTSDLDRRLQTVEKKVTYLGMYLSDVINRQEMTLSLLYVNSLIIRIQTSMEAGYETLREIIHCSLLSQTSPLLLPLAQVDKLQSNVRLVSGGILDTDFSRMKSIVVADPTDSHKLVVIINIAILSRRNSELIELIAIPTFDKEKAFSPILDYKNIILDQAAGTYSILDNSEVNECLQSRCYVHDIERSINEPACGIPQYYERQDDKCLFEESPSNGIFLKQLLPDGLIFAFRKEVHTQLFCKDDAMIGPSKKLQGTGLMALPQGCTLAVSDKEGKVTKVRGQPLSRMMNAEEVELVVSELLKPTQISSPDGPMKFATHGSLLTDHMLNVVRQVEAADDKIEKQFTFLWSFIVVTCILALLVIAIALFTYRYSGRFRNKVYDLRDRCAEIKALIPKIEISGARLPTVEIRPRQGGEAPPVAPRPARVTRGMLARARANFRPRSIHRDTFLQLGRKTQPLTSRAQAEASCPPASRTPTPPSPYVSLSDIHPERDLEQEHTYSAFQPIDSPVVKPAGTPRQYPRMTPLVQDLENMRLPYLDSRVTESSLQLRDESRQVLELCSPRTFRHRQNQ